MPRAARRKPTVNYTETSETEIEHKAKTTATNGIAGKVIAKVKKVAAAAAHKRKAESDAEPDAAEPPSKPAKKRKTKAKDEDAMPLAGRTAVSSLKQAMYIGAHVSAAGGVQNAVTGAVHIGANAFALFLKSQRKWENPPLAPEAKDLFISNCKSHHYDAGEHALPHGSYLVNLAADDAAKAAQAYKTFVDDLIRCDHLGIKLYNFHPGNTNGEPRPEAIGRIAAQLNRSHKESKAVITVLENMAGTGNVIGSTWEDLRDIIALVEDKSRVGVCIDTCHAFAAGHDLRTPEAFKATMDAFNTIVGAEYLKAFHLNDSKAPFNSHRDLHANIGTGFLGLRAFHSVVNCAAFSNKPMVLETPIDRKGPDGKAVEDKQVWADEIKLLESLIGMDPEGDDFKRLEKELQVRGEEERGRIQTQVDKKAEKDAKKGTRGKKKTAKADTDEDSE